MKRTILTCMISIISMIFCNSSFAQHLSFLGVELGCNSEFFIYELKKKGFSDENKENLGCLYGKFLGVDCRLWVYEEKGVVKHLTIAYRYKEDFGYERAKTLVEGVTMILCKEFDERKIKYYAFKDPSASGDGSDIHLENGWYNITSDGSWSALDKGWRVFVKVYDEPDNMVFKANMHQEGRNIKKQ